MGHGASLQSRPTAELLTLLLFLSVSLLSCSPKQHCEFETRMCESYIIYLEQYPIQKGTYCTYLQTYFA